MTRTPDKIYLENRKSLAGRMGPRELWDIMDHWPLYVGVRNLARFLAIYELVKSSLSVPGDIAEFGSWRGANLVFMAKLLVLLEPHGLRRVHCFDSFQGLRAFAPADGDQSATAGRYKGSREELEEMITLYRLDGIVIHEGLIEERLPHFLEEEPGTQFSLVYFDADLYKAATSVLNLCHERLVKGGVFVFDEWNLPQFPGEAIAVQEFMKVHGDSYALETVPGTAQPSLILRRIK